MMLVTNNGEYRLREIIDVKQGFKDLKKETKKKIRSGIEEYHEWKNK